jgi:hypothetical protein
MYESNAQEKSDRIRLASVVKMTMAPRKHIPLHISCARVYQSSFKS